MSTYLLAIDPSINSLGYAYFIEGKLEKYGTFKAATETKELTTLIRIQAMWDLLFNEIWLAECSIDMVVVEEPEQFGSYKSQASTGAGDIKKLLLTVGFLAGAITEVLSMTGAEVELLPVRTWKGQLPKAVTKKRMETKYGVTFETTDECDAVGIGDWWLTHKGVKDA